MQACDSVSGVVCAAGLSKALSQECMLCVCSDYLDYPLPTLPRPFPPLSLPSRLKRRRNRLKPP